MGQPAVLRFTQNGRAVLNMSVADTPRRFNKDTNEWEDAGETLWARVSVWGEDAQALAEQLGEGKHRVTVVGRAGWETFQRNDGSQGAAFTINAASIAVHAPKEQQQQPGGFAQTQGFDQNQQAPTQDPWGGGGNDQSPPF